MRRFFAAHSTRASTFPTARCWPKSRIAPGWIAQRFLADLQSERMAPRISENKREADGQSALGYPTFILGEFPLIGIQPKDTMRLIFARYMRQRGRKSRQLEARQNTKTPR